MKKTNGNGANGAAAQHAAQGSSVGPYLRALTSDLVARADFAARSGVGGDLTSFGGKRDLNLALGYESRLRPQDYRNRYERGGIAERIVEAYPRATWSGGAAIIENPDPNTATPFETAVTDLFDRLDVWARLLRADILSGLGRYSILLIGADGDLSTELPRMAGTDSVLYLTPLGENRASIELKVDQSSDPRFGLPLTYKVDLRTGRQLPIHWTRVLHIAEGLLEDDVYGKPRLRSIWNYLDDLAKIVGGGAEAAWKRMHPGMQLDMDPEYEAGEGEEEAMQEQLEEYEHGLRRHMLTKGLKLNLLSAAVNAFGSNADSVIQLISATTGIPHRILTGSERGELASLQDRNNWNDRIAERRREFAVPLVNQFLTRLIERGAIPEPAEYEVVWPDTDELSESEKAEVAEKIARANQAQFKSEGVVILTSNEIRDVVLGMGPLEEVDKTEQGDEGNEGENGEDEPDVDEDDPATLRASFKYTDTPPDDEPEWAAIHRAADSHIAGLKRFLLESWTAASAQIDAGKLETYLDRHDENAAVRLTDAALIEVEDRLRADMPDLLMDVLTAGAESTLKVANRRGGWRSAGQTQPDSGSSDGLLDLPLRRLASFTPTFDASNPRAYAWAAIRSSSLITEIQPDTRQAVRSLIADGLKQGVAPRKLAGLVKEVVGLRSDQVGAVNNLVSRLTAEGWSEDRIEARRTRYARKLLRDRAILIARTEAMRSASEGQREVWRQAQDRGELPTDQERVWIVTPDNRLREKHRVMEGARAKITEPFVGPDGAGIEPGSEPACRCTSGLV